jgi:hypothetical protein
MREWQQRVWQATAAVRLKAGAKPVGSAVLIDTGRLVTCRHLLSADAYAAPWGQQLWVTFPGGHPVGARVFEAADGIDALILDLQSPDDDQRVPEPVLLSGSARQPGTVAVFGYPAKDLAVAGVWRDFSVAGPAGNEYQLNWIDAAGTMSGHSGGPVVDVRTGRLVGLLTAGSEQGRFDRYLPLTALRGRGLLERLPWLMEGDDAQGHFTRRSRGHRGQDVGQSVFTGRAAARARIRDWLTASQTAGNVLVVTGQPGAGKSAVLARVGLELAEGLGQRDRGLLFHARQATVEEFRVAVADLFGAADDTSRDGLLKTADIAAQAQPNVRWVIAVDGLDEARTKSDRHKIAVLLVNLALRPWVRAAVATRWLAADPFHIGSFLAEFGVRDAGAHNLILLDSPDYFQEADLAAYVRLILCQSGVRFPLPGRAWLGYRDDPGLTNRMADAVARRVGSNFLVATLIASRLAEDIVTRDPAEGFDPRGLPASIGSALDDLLDARDNGALLRGVLTALAYAPGTGYSDRDWQAAAAAIGYPVSQADLDELRRGRFADYLLQTTASTGGMVTRVFHQALADQLLSTRDQHHDQARIDDAIDTRTFQL